MNASIGGSASHQLRTVERDRLDTEETQPVRISLRLLLLGGIYELMEMDANRS